MHGGYTDREERNWGKLVWERKAWNPQLLCKSWGGSLELFTYPPPGLWEHSSIITNSGKHSVLAVRKQPEKLLECPSDLLLLLLWWKLVTFQRHETGELGLIWLQVLGSSGPRSSSDGTSHTAGEDGKWGGGGHVLLSAPLTCCNIFVIPNTIMIIHCFIYNEITYLPFKLKIKSGIQERLSILKELISNN